MLSVVEEPTQFLNSNLRHIGNLFEIILFEYYASMFTTKNPKHSITFNSVELYTLEVMLKC